MDEEENNEDDPIDGVGAVGVALTELATAPVYPFSDEQLMASLDALEHHRRLLDATTSHLLAELDRREVPDRRHGLSTTAWYAREAQLPGGVARRRLIDARAMSRKFFDLDTALSKGECGLHHASTIIEVSNPRIADDLAALTPELIALIPGRTFRRWRQDVENIARLLDQDGDYSPEADESANRLSISPVINGERNIRARLVGSWAETVQQAIETVADELLGQFRRDAEHTTDLAIPDRSTLRALALVEICRRASACDGSRTSAPTTDLTVVVPAGPPLPGDMRLPPGFDGWAGAGSSGVPDPRHQPWSHEAWFREPWSNEAWSNEVWSTRSGPTRPGPTRPGPTGQAHRCRPGSAGQVPPRSIGCGPTPSTVCAWPTTRAECSCVTPGSTP